MNAKTRGWIKVAVVFALLALAGTQVLMGAAIVAGFACLIAAIVACLPWKVTSRRNLPAGPNPSPEEVKEYRRAHPDVSIEDAVAHLKTQPDPATR